MAYGHCSQQFHNPNSKTDIFRLIFHKKQITKDFQVGSWFGFNFKVITNIAVHAVRYFNEPSKYS